MPITLMRHTRPAIAPGICYGISDIALADSFIADTSAALSLITQPTAIVTSPLKRCKKLAQLAAQKFDLPYSCDTDLAEMDFGSWEGVAWEHIPRAELDAWARDFMHARPHGGESVEMVYRRAKRAIALYGAPNTITLFITHGGFIKAALAGDATERSFQTTIDFGSSVTLRTPA